MTVEHASRLDLLPIQRGGESLVICAGNLAIARHAQEPTGQSDAQGADALATPGTIVLPRQGRNSAARRGGSLVLGNGDTIDISPDSAPTEETLADSSGTPTERPDDNPLNEEEATIAAEINTSVPQAERGDVWELVERAQAGDMDAFGQIYSRYQDTAFRFVHFRVGNRPLAEDLTQETFLRALKRMDSVVFQGRDLGAWLVTIARNLVADHFKSGRYRFELSASEPVDPSTDPIGNSDPRTNPELAVLSNITNDTLRAAVSQLNPAQRKCIMLRFFEELSVAETAAAMGTTEGAVKAMQSRATKALSRMLPDGFAL